MVFVQEVADEQSMKQSSDPVQVLSHVAPSQIIVE